MERNNMLKMENSRLLDIIHKMKVSSLTFESLEHVVKIAKKTIHRVIGYPITKKMKKKKKIYLFKHH